VVAALKLKLTPGQQTSNSRRTSNTEAYNEYSAIAQYTLGRAKESQQALDEAIAKNAQDAAYQISQVYAWRREKEKAFKWLERAYNQRDGGLSEIKVDVLLSSLHGDPRFAAMLRKMHLPEE
jgi:hypothetical protein